MDAGRTDEPRLATDGGRDRRFRQVVSTDGAVPTPLPDEGRGADTRRGPDRERASDRTRTDRDGDTRGRRVREIERSAAFRAVSERSRFDDLAVVAPRDRGRYADAIRVRATTGGDERGVSLGLLDRPDGENGNGFSDDVADALARWQGASDAAGVVTVHDWATEPRPWLATEPVGRTLAEWDRPDVATVLRAGLDVADAVAALHGRGVVHGGIDPGNVVRRADTLAERPRPLLTNVSLMHAFREHFRPADYLDPRYAAPEYFDADFGRVDQSTDVYGLGAVLYRLFTGRAPFQGTYGEVRTGVLEADPTPPTAHDASLPDPVDDVLAKALAKQKLLRYETAAQLRTDLGRVCERSGYGI